MPRSFVEFTGGPGDENCDCAGDEVWWAGEDESNGGGKAESLDDGREL